MTGRIGIRRKELAQLLGVGASTVQRLTVQPDFPKPRRVHECSIWVASEVEAWLKRQPSAEGRGLRGEKSS